MLIVAEKDRYVPARHHEELAGAIRQAGGEATVHVLPSNSHTASQAAILESESKVRALVRAFIEDAAF